MAVVKIVVALIVLLEGTKSQEQSSCQDPRFLNSIGITINEELNSETTIFCGVTDSVSFTCQLYSQRISQIYQPRWIINGVEYSSNHLPDENHSYDASSAKLTVRNIRRDQNNTVYQCKVQIILSNGSSCEYYSTGRLIFKDRALTTRVQPYYRFKDNTLKRIYVQINDQIQHEQTTYKIIYNSTEKICYSAIIPPSSCEGGKCTHNFSIKSMSACLSSTNILVTISATEGDDCLDYSSIPGPVAIDASNNFVNISFNETSQVNCFFTGSAVHVNESKHCMVKYGPETSTGCNYTLRNNGSSTSSSVSIGLTWNDTQATICFTILAKSGEKSIYVEGSYHLNKNPDDESIIIVAVIITLFLIIFTFFGCWAIVYAILICVVNAMISVAVHAQQSPSAPPKVPKTVRIG